MSYRLHITVGNKDFGIHDVLPDSELIVGRDPGCDLVIPDRSVSRRHCRIRMIAGGIELVDLASANGLFVNGELLQRVIMTEGDVVNLGMAKLKASRASSHTGMIPITGLLESIQTGGPGGDPMSSISSWSESSSGAFD